MRLREMPRGLAIDGGGTRESSYCGHVGRQKNHRVHYRTETSFIRATQHQPTQSSKTCKKPAHHICDTNARCVQRFTKHRKAHRKVPRHQIDFAPTTTNIERPKNTITNTVVAVEAHFTTPPPRYQQITLTNATTAFSYTNTDTDSSATTLAWTRGVTVSTITVIAMAKHGDSILVHRNVIATGHA